MRRRGGTAGPGSGPGAAIQRSRRGAGGIDIVHTMGSPSAGALALVDDDDGPDAGSLALSLETNQRALMDMAAALKREPTPPGDGGLVVAADDGAAPSPLLLMPDKARRFLEKRPSYGSYGADGHGGARAAVVSVDSEELSRGDDDAAPPPPALDDPPAAPPPAGTPLLDSKSAVAFASASASVSS